MEYDVSLQTIAWINERNNIKSLVISPKFQRRPVWLEKERSELMSTICSNLPFPEIYVQVETDLRDGTQKYVVVDGQQRITSILMFINGDVSLPNDETWIGKNFSDLDPDQQSSFWNYKLVVRSLRNTSDVEIRDLFTRLNTNNFSLNDQELRNARYSGKFKNTSERLADNPFFQGIGLFSAREVRRMEDIEYVSELLLLTVEGITNKKDMLDDAYAKFNEDFPRESEYENEFNSTVNMIRSLVLPENESYIKTKSTFYSLFGACLNFQRIKRRTFFKKIETVQNGFSAFIIQSRSNPPNSASTEVKEYFDSVSRATSDRNKREKRERLLFNLLTQLDE